MILPNLNPLRFFLAFLVMLYHIPQFFANRGLPFFNDFPIFHRGREAVYVFFVLSGFLIIRLLYREKVNNGSISIKNFYIRRILRIYPLYFLILIIGMLYYNVVLDAVGIPYDNDYNMTNALLLFVFFLPNVAAVLYQPGGVLEILWSIGIEEQFYLVIAPLFLFLKKEWLITFFGLFTLVYFMIFAVDVLPFLRKFDFLYFYFSAGGILAILHERYEIGHKINSYFKWLLLVAFMAYFFTDIFQIGSSNLYHGIGIVLFSFTILTLSYAPVFTIRNQFFNYLGSISYGVYMYHALVMQLIGFIVLKLVDKIQLSNVMIILLSYVLVIIATLIIAHFSYQYFEKPFLKLKNKFR